MTDCSLNMCGCEMMWLVILITVNVDAVCVCVCVYFCLGRQCVVCTWGKWTHCRTVQNVSAEVVHRNSCKVFWWCIFLSHLWFLVFSSVVSYSKMTMLRKLVLFICTGEGLGGGALISWVFRAYIQVLGSWQPVLTSSPSWASARF
jgi:hypothetical protein